VVGLRDTSDNLPFKVLHVMMMIVMVTVMVWAKGQ
jgi:hypothetical protein